jgi:hypothetical protein
MSGDWLDPNIAQPLSAPLASMPGSRSAELLRQVVDQFDVEHAERYRVRDIDGNGKRDTFCNIFASDVTRALFAEVPHQWQGAWQNVHAMADWIRAGLGKWKACAPWLAQVAADQGHPALAIYDPALTSKGHIAVLVPSEGRPGVWIAQAGARNYRRAPLLAGFGVYASETQFFSHE